MRMRRIVVLLAVSLALSAGHVFGEDREEEEEEGGRKARAEGTNNAYVAACRQCHFAYPLKLLPAAAWVDILDKPGRHAGGDLDLSAAAKAEVRKYIAEKGSGRGRSKKSGKEVQAAPGGEIRVSELPRIKEKHRDIKQEVFARKSIGSRGNCVACHKAAAKGDFDGVEIPKN